MALDKLVISILLETTLFRACAIRDNLTHHNSRCLTFRDTCIAKSSTLKLRLRVRKSVRQVNDATGSLSWTPAKNGFTASPLGALARYAEARSMNEKSRAPEKCFA